MSKYLVKYEAGPTAADCYERIVDGESETQAGLNLWKWVMENEPYLLRKIIVTSYERVIE